MSENLEDYLKILLDAAENESIFIHKAAVLDGYRDLLKLSSFGIGKFLKKATEIGGKKGAHVLKEQYNISIGKNLSDGLYILTAVSEMSRVVSSMEYSVDKMEIYIDRSLLVESVPESKKPVCEPISGFFKGFLNELLNGHYNIEEISCKAQGYDRCIFKIIEES